MWKKLIIISLVLIVAGTSLVGWYKYQENKLDRLTEKQQALLEKSTGNINEIIEGKTDSQISANFESTSQLEAQIDNLATGKENRELTLNFAVLLLSIGIAVIGSCLLVFLSKLFLKAARISADLLKEHLENKKEQKFGRENLWLLKQAKLLTKSGWLHVSKNEEEEKEPDFVEEENKKVVQAVEDDSKDDDSELSDKPFNELMLCKEEVDGESFQNYSCSQESPKKAKKHDKFNPFSLLTSKNQSSTTEPINSALQELTQQVSAIREYASFQQDRVEKLQDGYDWSIIRTFCIKIIRCIDNLETRIENLRENNEDTTALEEIRDELVFALESSGVEQYQPDLESDYRGQEKKLEAVQRRQPCGDKELKGKIAKVVRHGYKYVLDDENYKVVRTAQVQLFG